MTRQEAEAKYHRLGLTTRHITDQPGEIYEPHAHEEVYLFTLTGSLKLRLDNGPWQTVEPGQEVHIKTGQRHEAVAGSNGWEYIFAASAAEIKRQGL
jgi:quercetin dioxygenase-like cupin family protein